MSRQLEIAQRKAEPEAAAAPLLPTLRISTHGACVNEGQHNALASIGVYFNGPEWSDCNISEKVPKELKPHSATLGGYYAMARALRSAPDGYDLVIQTDNELCANTINLCLGDEKTSANDSRAFAHLSHDNVIRRILQVVHRREKEGYGVVELVFAGKDPDSQTCLAAARRLAAAATSNGSPIAINDLANSNQCLSTLSTSPGDSTM